MNFSEKLVFLREKNGLSQIQLADELKVPRMMVEMWEADRKEPQLGDIVKISEYFNVSIDSLLKDEQSFSDENVAITDNKGDMSTPYIQEVLYCSKCGKENTAGSLFCGYCGNPFTFITSDKKENGKLTKEDVDLAYYKADLQMKHLSLQIQQQALEESRRQTEQQMEQLRIQKVQYDAMMKCPRCGSTSLSGNKKGYGIGKGVVGAMVVGPLGLMAGNIGSGKVKVTCMQCGYKFKPKKTR